MLNAVSCGFYVIGLLSYYDDVVINPWPAHAQQRLRYLVCMCVCVCLSSQVGPDSSICGCFSLSCMGFIGWFLI